jgi:glycosyltransferase involved in cell wall biosynthesis
MKIALITSMKYGLTQFIFRDTEALVNKGHHVGLFTILAAKGLYNPLPEWDVHGVSWWRAVAGQLWLLLCHPLRYARLFATAVRTKSLINFIIATSFTDRMKNYDVIYAYFGDHKLFTGYYCKQITGIPLVVTIRAYELYRNPNPNMFKLALSACDQIVTVSQHNKSLLTSRFGASASHIDIVRQIIDLDAYKMERKIKILTVGFFAEKKGYDVLFKAFQQLGRDDVELWVVGDKAPDRNGIDCRQLVKELGLTERVAFFGAQGGTSLRALYRECDIFCLPSRTDRFGDKEGFPNVIAEAMAFSKPVVSTHHAGIPEVVKTFLVEENNVPSLADALHEACDSMELWPQLGKENRAEAERLFSPANNDRLVQILHRSTILARKSTNCRTVAMDNK